MAVSNRSARLRRLARALNEQYGLDYRQHQQIEPEYDDARTWTYTWTDGPTVEQVKRAARKADPEATDGLRYERRLSQETFVLGLVRHSGDRETETDGLERPYLAEMAVEELWRKVPSPKPRTERERLLVEAIVTEANGGRGRGWASRYELCRLVQERGLAPFLERAVELAPIEVLTVRYASGRGSMAWRHRLKPLTAQEAFSAVQADPEAPADAVAAALTLVPELHAALDAAAAALRSRTPPAPPRPALAVVPGSGVDDRLAVGAGDQEVVRDEP
ncbi:hypothetical protein [Streptomyces sp. DH12]|uniref:hypothetical protein n=1 Tax=Streptomyces sp. DH12 TaxID=2857010 RepID=UPI001E627C8E|nr:hypothetical protein [Streptomyces sp. DH12]